MSEEEEAEFFLLLESEEICSLATGQDVATEVARIEEEGSLEWSTVNVTGRNEGSIWGSPSPPGSAKAEMAAIPLLLATSALATWISVWMLSRSEVFIQADVSTPNAWALFGFMAALSMIVWLIAAARTREKIAEGARGVISR